MKKQEKLKKLSDSKSIIMISILMSVIILISIVMKPQMVKERKAIKEMTESEQTTNLQTQINNLQASHEEYANIVQSGKNKLATAITNKGVETSNTVDLETMAANIEKIEIVEKDEGKDETAIGPVSGGSYDKPYIPSGFSHMEGDGTWNSGYVIRDGMGNEFVWVPCVTDQNKVKRGDTVVTFGKVTTPGTKYNENNYTITGEVGTTASEIEASVATYGGFYIARYEAGISGTTHNEYKSTKTAVDGSVKPLSKLGCALWNSIRIQDAITVSNKMIDTATTGAKSALISGSCWDTTLQWIIYASDNKSNEPNLGYDTNSTGNGWYNDVADGRRLTGYYPVNNIYDMAGNVHEWTTEYFIGPNDGRDYRVYRGGYHGYSGSDQPAANRNCNSTYYNTSSNAVGFRVVLYKSV